MAGRRAARSIEGSLAALVTVGTEPTWVLSNHDVARHVTRYAYAQPDHPIKSLSDLPADIEPDIEPDLELGTRRARAAALLMLALPGGAYIYGGEELGLPEVDDLPEAVLDDPTWERSGHTDRGRDGTRVSAPGRSG